VREIPKGSIIFCKFCCAEIAQVLVNLYDGDKIEASMVKGIQKPIKAKEPMICECGSSYFPFNFKINEEKLT
jgi:hypothetical protein